MIKDYFSIPWREMKRRKMRSWLTLIGIIIGIAAVISLIALGQGLQNAIAEQFDALGNDKLIIAPEGSALTAGLSIDAVKLTQDDRDVVEGVAGIGKTAGFIFSTARIEYNDNVRYFFIYGNPDDFAERELIGESQNYKLANGRTLDKGDKFKAVLGHDYTKPGLFGQAVEVGDKINIQGTEFKAIGFWEKIGSPPDDQSISIPLETYWDVLGQKKELGLIIAQVQPGEDPDKVAEKVTKELRSYRGLEEGKEDFSIETPVQLAATFTTILDIVQAVLIGIAGISLLVGGVGIMNTMYTSVLQRTKQIGLLKAMGAQDKHIMALFLVESGLYGFGGGLIGVLIGITFAKSVEFLFSSFASSALLVVKIDPFLVLGALSFSFIVGCLSGFAPARRAAKLHPVDALRYE